MTLSIPHKAIFSAFGWVAVVAALSFRLGPLPPFGVLLSPTHGFWRNAEPLNSDPASDMTEFLPISNNLTVTYDARGVPHIFAQNEYDLYLAQGYLTARDRLWQMELQTHAAAGRLSEIMGERTLSFDLEQRRAGMTWAAERSLAAFANDSLSLAIINAYTEGVNTYINQLNDADLPIEYKLLGYKPEPWTPLKCALLLKHMAKMLTWTENDREHSALLELLGREMFNQLYPDPRIGPDPVVEGTKIDSAEMLPLSKSPIETKTAYWPKQPNEPRHVGSNNWAVAGSRTASGLPLLANDPHLRLGLPSIWYEIQLSAPGLRCRGVSLPGSPGIVIGFNDSIAWGVTNAGRDVKDYYLIKFENENRQRYAFNNGWRKATARIEQIKVRGARNVIDTVVYTHYGPVFIPNDDEGSAWAMRWTAHDPSNEMMTFYRLNRARNHADYMAALDLYACPPQNFVYADAQGHIAIRQQGFYPLREKEHGRFLMLTDEDEARLARKIPYRHNPNQFDPERGFVSSANQTAADSAYPYYYTGVFEEFRNQTINQTLDAAKGYTAIDMMRLQMSDRNMLAENALPHLLRLLDTTRFYTENEALAYSFVKKWDAVNNAESFGATVFQIWWDELHNMLYDEINNPAYRPETYYRDSWVRYMETRNAQIDIRDKRYVYPEASTTLKLLREGTHPWFDNHFTPNKTETARDVVSDAFYWTAVKFGDIVKYKLRAPNWAAYKATRIQHLLRLDALSSPELPVGGNENAPNAMTAQHGPSWRMVVQLDPKGPKAFGVLPGGQSGNPGSPRYMDSLDKWVKGEYHTIELFESPEIAQSKGHTRFEIKSSRP